MMQDKLVGKPAAETLSVVESIVALNHLQIQRAELSESQPDSLAALSSKDNLAFLDLRAEICKQRPRLTELVDLDGRLKPCQQH